MSLDSGASPIAQIDDPERRGTRLREHLPHISALDVAENILLMDELSELISESPLQLTRSDLNYPHDSIGGPIVRAAIAELLSQSWGLHAEKSLSTEHVLCTPGATAALHLHAKARLREGDTVLVPAPYWQMFDRIYREARVSLVPVPIPLGAPSAIDLPALQEAHARLVASGERPRMLLLTNPHNPLGIVESEASLRALFDWALAETEMEIVSDEIYAHSIFDPTTPFVSALHLDVSLRHSDRVHVVWGFAKDFGLSGWMVGVLLTRCAELHETITRHYARFSPFDGLKNRVLGRLLCERKSPSEEPLQLLRLLPERLRLAQQRVAQALREQEILFSTHASGGPFFWLDLRPYLDADLAHAPHPAECVLDGPEQAGFDPREGRLQKYLACAAGVVLLRGQTMHAPSPGFYRLCFSAEPLEQIVAAVQRMGAALHAAT